MYDCVLTIGCFDRFHNGHDNLLREIKKNCKTLIVGIHDNVSIEIIKNISDVQPLEIRKRNIELYTDKIFVINHPDPTEDTKLYLESNFDISEFGKDKFKICYMRADDNIDFPGKNYIESLMPIKYTTYTKSISSSILRSRDNRIGVFDLLLKTLSNALKDNNVLFYLDCGTLLGCIRDKQFILYDTDVDVTTHISFREKVKAINFDKYGLEVWRNNNSVLSVNLKCSKLYCDVYYNKAFPFLEERILNGHIYHVPKQPELYLKQLYGEWKIRSCEHADYAFHRGYGLINSEYKLWDYVNFKK
jgi:cytidyltransferase-like protein